MENKPENSPMVAANPGYASFQIAKALTTIEQHPDPATRVRAVQRIEKWMAVLNGMAGGQLNIGSRTPVAGTPGWVTLEVATGGFVTGKKLAGGPLLDHERALLNRLPPVSEADARRLLNRYHLTDEGLASIQDCLRSGRYEVTVPEEGALLVVAWLVQNRHLDDARILLETLAPYFPELRFYPVPAERPRASTSQVFVQKVGDTIKAIEAIGPNREILAQREAVVIWAPLYDRMVALFLETVEGQPPYLRRDSDGQRSGPDANGRFPVKGGWPCKHYPDGWHARAQAILDDIEHRRLKHTLCGRPEHPKDPFYQLREFIRRCIEDPRSLNGRDVGKIRLILAGYVDKHGTPESARCRTFRDKQAGPAHAATFQEIARVVSKRLAAYPKDLGLDDVQGIVGPVSGEEAAGSGVAAGTFVPATLQRKVQRCLCETVEALVSRKVITSAEVLARVLPQMTSGLRAAGINDFALRQLYAAIYRAFRCRRSLLLLNLESQIRINELPWVAAIDRFRHETPSTRETARQTLQEVAGLTLCSFPHMVIPNKLVQELRALAKGAELDLPLVDELAADIFMGEFGAHFVKASKTAAGLLGGTLYETYYGIDYQLVRKLPEPASQKSWFAGRSPDALAQMCSAMAGVSGQGGDTAINGMVIEQQQILTTQNLAVLYQGLGLHEMLHDRLYDLAQSCLVWVCRRQQVKASLWHAHLIMLKNTAYAWRQMIFFLSLLPADRVSEFLVWAGEHLQQQDDAYRVRFRPALLGLELAAGGRSPEDASRSARRFLGWSKQRHWLLS